MYYTTPSRFGLTFDEVRKLYPDISFPPGKPLTSGEVLSYETTPTPDYDPSTHGVRESAPANGVQQWAVYPLPAGEVQANAEASQAANAKRLQDKIEALWQAADLYTSGYISGVAIGILTIGVLQQLPKAVAVTAWSSAIWAEYYARKALVTATSEDNHDFTAFGPIPHSVPELQAEVGL